MPSDLDASLRSYEIPRILTKTGVTSWLMASLLHLALAATPVASHPLSPANKETPGDLGLSFELPGLYVEEIEPGSALDRAGVEAGDLLVAWYSPNSPGRMNTLADHLDWLELVENEAPKGTVILELRRGSDIQHRVVEVGRWSVGLRPRLSAQAIDFEQQMGQQAAVDGCSVWQIETSKDMTWSQFYFASEGSLVWIITKIVDERLQREDVSRRLAVVDLALPWVADLRARAALSKLRAKIFIESNQGKSALNELLASLNDVLQLSSGPQLASWKRLIGLALCMEGAWSDSIRWFEEARQVFEAQASGSSIAAVTLVDHGIALEHLGRLEEAARLLAEAVLILERVDIPTSEPLARAQKYLGYIHADLGNWALARLHYTHSRDIYRKISRQETEVANTISLIAGTAEQLGDFTEAEALLLEALSIVEEFGQRSQTHAVVLINLGVVNMERGDWDKAGYFLLEAGKVGNLLGKDSRAAALYLMKVATLDLHRKNWEAAKNHINQSNEILRRIGGGEWQTAQNNMLMGIIALREENFSQAIELLRQAFGYLDRSQPKSTECRQAREKLAGALARSGNPAEARLLLEKSLEIEIGRAEDFRLGETLSDLGEVYRQLGQLGQAEATLKKGVELLRLLAPGTLRLATALQSSGLTARDLQKKNESIRFFREAAGVLDDLSTRLGGSYESRAVFRERSDSILSEFLPLLLEAEGPAAALTALERYRTRLFRIMATERRQAPASAISGGELSRSGELVGLYNSTVRKLQGLNTRDDGERIASLREELSTLRSQIGDIEAQAANFEGGALEEEIPNQLDLGSLLDRGSLMVQFSIRNGVLRVFTLTRGTGVRVSQTPVDEEQLRSLVEKFVETIKELRSRTQIDALRISQMKRQGSELFDLLFGPVSSELAAAERVIIVPDGALNYLPFSALRVGGSAAAPEMYFVEWKPIRLARSLTAGVGKIETKIDRHRQGLENRLRLIAFGDPDRGGDSRAESDSRAEIGLRWTERSAVRRGLMDWAALPYSRLEVESLKPIATADSQFFLGRDASEAVIKRIEGPADVLHIASHAAVDEVYPLSSFVVLSAGNSEDGEDGLLQAWEILRELNLKGIDLVVLSACETGRGRTYRGEGIFGLTQAFQLAGARSVLSSLWRVDDEQTASFMASFYLNLQKGQPFDEAVRSSQMDFIHGRALGTTSDRSLQVVGDASVYSWAAFQLYGSP